MQLPAAEAQIVSHLDQILPFKTYSKIQKRISELIPIETVRFKVEETNITKFSLEDWLQAQIRDPIKKRRCYMDIITFIKRESGKDKVISPKLVISIMMMLC